MREKSAYFQIKFLNFKCKKKYILSSSKNALSVKFISRLKQLL